MVAPFFSSRLPDRKSLALELQVSTLQQDRGKIIRGLLVAGFGAVAVGDEIRSLTSGGVSDTYPRNRFSRSRFLLTTAYRTAVSFIFFAHLLFFITAQPAIRRSESQMVSLVTGTRASDRLSEPRTK